MAIDVKGLICPQCGSNDVTLSDEKNGVCRACGSKFMIASQQVVFNEIHVHTDGANGEADGKVTGKYRLTTKCDKEAFMRKALIELYNDGDMPFDIFSSDISKPEEHIGEVIQETIRANINYSASSGTDRQEQYVDVEKYRDSQGVQRQRNVIKTRTVTDWTPITGTKNDVETIALDNNGGDSGLSSFIENKDTFIDSYLDAERKALAGKEADALTLKLNDLNQMMLERMHQKAQERIIEKVLPGQHIKDLDCSVAAVTKRAYALILAPEYIMNIKYEGETGSVYSYPFTSKLPIIPAKLPGAVSKRDGLIMQKFGAAIKKCSKYFGIYALSALGAAVAFALLKMNVLEPAGLDWTKFLFMAASAGAFAYGMADHVKMQKAYNNFEADVKKQKFDGLNKVLKAFGLKQAEESELSFRSSSRKVSVDSTGTIGNPIGTVLNMGKQALADRKAKKNGEGKKELSLQEITKKEITNLIFAAFVCICCIVIPFLT